MRIRRAEIRDLEAIQTLNNQLFELELENFDKYLIKDWPLSDEGGCILKMQFQILLLRLPK